MPLPQANPFDDHMTWYYNKDDGTIKHITNWFERQWYNGLGWWIRFKTREDAETYKRLHPPSHQNHFSPLNPNNPVNPGLKKAAGAAGNAVTGVTNDVLKPLFQSNIWVRVGEVVLGVVLIAVGVARITNVVPVATKIAKAVA